MTTDLRMLALGCLWVVVVLYIPVLARTHLHGLAWGASNRAQSLEEPAWLGRADRAFRNLMETFPLFASLVLVTHVAGRHDATSALATQIWLGARVAHALLYIAGVTYVRTLAFWCSLGAILTLAWRLLAP